MNDEKKKINIVQSTRVIDYEKKKKKIVNVF